jgi:SAM-dependent methyltransferase
VTGRQHESFLQPISGRNAGPGAALDAGLDAALRQTADAFDSVAQTYDGPQGNNHLIQRMRQLTWARIDQLVPQPSTLIDIGCGTGLDAQRFAGLGHRVLATDWSPAMVQRAQARAASTDGRIQAVRVGAQELDVLVPDHLDSIDLAYSNFGPLNCVPDLGATGRALAQLVRPGGHAVFTVIGRWCPWEIAHYARQRRWQRLAVRFRRGMTPVNMNGHTIWTRYHTPRSFIGEWNRGGDWSVVGYEGLSTFVPPPYLTELSTKRPQLSARLERIDARTAAWPVIRSVGDHFLIVLRRI